ncbi:hypothetical protein ACVOMT_15845 [Sphingomonas panni]
MIEHPATPRTPPLRKTIQPPAASISPIEASPAPAASITISTPAPVATPQYGHVLDAMAMMKAQRPVAPFGRSAQDMSGRAEDDVSKAIEGQPRLTVPPVREAAEPVGSPQPNEADAATVPDQTSAKSTAHPPLLFLTLFLPPFRRQHPCGGQPNHKVHPALICSRAG